MIETPVPKKGILEEGKKILTSTGLGLIENLPLSIPLLDLDKLGSERGIPENIPLILLNTKIHSIKPEITTATRIERETNTGDEKGTNVTRNSNPDSGDSESG